METAVLCAGKRAGGQPLLSGPDGAVRQVDRPGDGVPAGDGADAASKDAVLRGGHLRRGLRHFLVCPDPVRRDQRFKDDGQARQRGGGDAQHLPGTAAK